MNNFPICMGGLKSIQPKGIVDLGVWFAENVAVAPIASCVWRKQAGSFFLG